MMLELSYPTHSKPSTLYNLLMKLKRKNTQKFIAIVSMILAPPLLLITLDYIGIRSIIADEICVLLGILYLLVLCPYLAVKT